MFGFLMGLFGNSITVKNVKDSTVNINQVTWLTRISRSKFKINDAWFDVLLARTFDDEIKAKYNSVIHQQLPFEERELADITNFTHYKSELAERSNDCLNSVKMFDGHFLRYQQFITAELIRIKNPDHLYIKRVYGLYNEMQKIKQQIENVRKILQGDAQKILLARRGITGIHYPSNEDILYQRSAWSELFSGDRPRNTGPVEELFWQYNKTQSALSFFNKILTTFAEFGNQKIIKGNAGTGKTHTSAYLIEQILSNGEYVIFFKPKLFSGDNVDLEDRILKLLQVPPGYTLLEILDRLDKFAKKKQRRCFIIIDALNETTRASIGFSNIWKNHLQTLINHISIYPHLYFICTLRTSYVDLIWNKSPENIIETRGFEAGDDIKKACERYFHHYRIKVSNLAAADLRYFKIPLLLDLFCRLTNETREDEKSIDLNLKSYAQIFENYIQGLTNDTKKKLNLQRSSPIEKGLTKSSASFYAKNEALLLPDDFTSAFDQDERIDVDNSIAQQVLEGYLIFIKEVWEGNEYIKHTQQEVGGYLIATYLLKQFDPPELLLASQDFIDKVIGDEPEKHHQLRLDILKFLITLHPQFIGHLTDSDSIDLAWWFLYNGFDPEDGSDIPERLVEQGISKIDFKTILYESTERWLDISHRLNFHFIARILKSLDLWSFDSKWTYFIYQESQFFSQIVERSTEMLTQKSRQDPEQEFLVAKLVIYTLSSTITDLRDKCTVYLIEYGQRYPQRLLSLTEYAFDLPDAYIYERLTQCCYGISLILQNNETYIRNDLPIIAGSLFNLQFGQGSKKSVYNYIVTDSIKHLNDLAIHKDVSTLNEEEKLRLQGYEFTIPEDWAAPTATQSELVNSSREREWPAPIGSDFGLYTIPRLLSVREYQNRRDAISNIYKRVYELHYQNLDSSEFHDTTFRKFYYGSRLVGYNSNVERLGKKFSWKGFFDYAGFLLSQKTLNVFQSINGNSYYSRLSDVDIDLSTPPKSYLNAIRLYQADLFSKDHRLPGWGSESKIETLTPFFQRDFDGTAYTMLYSTVEQRIGKDYKIRSYIMAETFFIKKNEDMEYIKTAIKDKDFDWSLDNHFSPDPLRHTYFGELYWADSSFSSPHEETISIPTGRLLMGTTQIKPMDILASRENYSYDDIGKEVEEKYQERIVFDSEPTLAEYLWETNSNVFRGHSEYYPSLRMGHAFKLASDPISGNILDQQKNVCFKSIHFDEDGFENTFNYLRTDLLRLYMEQKSLAILVQVKQHSYDEDKENSRFMQFYVIE